MKISRQRKIKLLKMCIELLKFGVKKDWITDYEPGLSELEAWVKEMELN